MTKKILYSENYVSLGLLLLRIGIGIAFIIHGFPKVFGGGAAYLAAAMTEAGIPGGLGGAYLAGLAEVIGGLTLIGGVLFRPTAIVLAFTMLVALFFHLSLNDPFLKYSHALESLVLFIALTFTGPGKFSFDYLLFSTDKKERPVKNGNYHLPKPSRVSA